MDPFDTLGVDARFDLDPDEIARRQRDLARALHPDRFSGAPATERRLALGRSIEVNEAARALKDPVKRAEALARRKGLPVGELTEPRPTPALLMEMMELREELAAAGKAKDAAALTRMAERMRAREQDVSSRLGAAFDRDVEPPGEALLSLLGELRYVRRFLDEVSAFEDALG
jgi:molecular chaperone HscB